MAIEIHPENLSDADRQVMVRDLEHLVLYDYPLAESIDVTQRSFTIRAKVSNGDKPGVQDMYNAAAIYSEAPFKLMQLLMKLLDIHGADELRAQGAGE